MKRFPDLRSCLVGLAACLPAAPVVADEADAPLRAWRAARVLSLAGHDRAPGVLLVRGDEIEAVLPAGAELPEGAEVVDLGDATLLPGLVNPLTAIDSPRGREPGRASARARSPRDLRKLRGLARVDPGDALWRRIGRTGYTALAVLPPDRGALIGGQASVIRPVASGEEDDAEDLALLESAYLFLGFSTGKAWYDAARKVIGATAEKIVEERKKAEEEEKKNEGKEKDAKAEDETKDDEDSKPPDPLRLVLEGEKTAFLRVTDPASIEHLFRYLEELPLSFRFVLVTGPLPPEIVERLAERRGRIEAVVLEPRMDTLWQTSIWVNTARLFLQHGFEVAFVPLSDDLEGHREVFYHLAEMVKSGVREIEALRAVTTVPARLLGLEERIGRLAPGAEASFTAWDRDPLSGRARLLRVVVAGREVYREDAATGEVDGEALR